MLNWYTSDQNYQNGKINKITKSLTEFFFQISQFFRKCMSPVHDFAKSSFKNNTLLGFNFQ